MRSLSVTLLSALSISACGLGQAGGGKSGIVLDGQPYVLKFVDRNRVVQLNEYYLEEEKPEAWTKMVSNAVYFTKGSPGEMARGMERSLLQSHPEAPHELKVAPDGGEAVFVCLNWAGDRQTTAEFDVFRFQKDPRGVLAHQLSLHPHQSKIPAADFTALRERWTKWIMTAAFPPIVDRLP